MNKQDLTKLFDYQQVDTQLYQIESVLKKSDARKKLGKSRSILLDGQKVAEEVESKIESQKKDLENIMSQFAALDEDVKALVDEGEKVEDAPAAKDMRKKAEKVNRDIKKMQQSIIAKLNDVNDAQKKYHDLVLQLQDAKKTFVESKAICESEIAQKQEEVDKIKKDLAKLEKGVDEGLLKIYAQKKKNGMQVVVKLENDQCAGCFMALPQLTIDQMKDSQEMTECENCGRILIVE